jgi:hypothetical protein
MLKSLKILKKTSVPSSLPFNYLSFIQHNFFGKIAKEIDVEGAIEKRSKLRYMKREANRDIAEALFFPDQSQKIVQEFVVKKL